DRPSENYLQMLARVKEIFGSCRIMYVLRNPLTQVPSEYLQNIIGKFVKQGRKWMEPSASLDINTWFENRTSRTSRPDEALNYNRNIQDSVELLGRDNVGVFLFEELMETPESYYRALSNFIGIDADETVALCQQKHFHPRISQGQLDLIRKINSSYVSRTLLPYFPTKLRLELLKKASGASSPAKIPLTPELHEKISTATKEGHRWLVENLNLPLAQYNYSL
ncbi:MAG: sulfotransferase domain-containing protein, partial [Desulfuromonadales bacterium]|nr:sulfotransferase domain-containing protein [Desulfuromonadales bacterium]